MNPEGTEVTKEANEQYYSGSREVETYSGRKKKKNTKTVVRSRLNRKFDLHVGGEVYTFAPYESKRLPKRVVNHPDFIRQRDKLLVKE
jgi:hypothetical protein